MRIAKNPAEFSFEDLCRIFILMLQRVCFFGKMLKREVGKMYEEHEDVNLFNICAQTIRHCIKLMYQAACFLCGSGDVHYGCGNLGY